MHILVNGWFAGQKTTGSGQYLDQLLPYLARQASTTQITLLTPAFSTLANGSMPVDMHPKIIVQPVGLPPIPMNLAKVWWEQYKVPQLAQAFRADVLWVPYWAAPWWQPVPTVVTVHDVIPLILPAYRGGWRNRLYTALVAATARRSTAILTVSHASKRDIVARLDVPDDQVYVVHHGPNEGRGKGGTKRQGDRETRRLSDALIRAKYKLPDRYFLYLGGFDMRKNLAGTLAAYQRYLQKGGDAQVKLVIGGKLPTIDTEFAPDPRRIATELGLGAQVHFCGWVADEDKPQLYALATAFIFPSTYEGFGMMVLEAMDAGTPVVTSAR